MSFRALMPWRERTTPPGIAHHAVAGLVITEAANVSSMSTADELAPGIYDDAQMAGWVRVADAEHAGGGKIFMPLWHGGRVASYALLNGRAPLSPSEMNQDLGTLHVARASEPCVVDSLGRPALTRRETDVLRVLARGRSDKQIARVLGIGPGTVKSHVKHLPQKLDATARTHAVVVANEPGLLSRRDGAAASGGADKEALVDRTPPPVDLWAVYPAGRMASAKARAFVDFARQAMDQVEALAPRPATPLVRAYRQARPVNTAAAP